MVQRRRVIHRTQLQDRFLRRRGYEDADSLQVQVHNIAAWGAGRHFGAVSLLEIGALFVTCKAYTSPILLRKRQVRRRLMGGGKERPSSERRPCGEEPYKKTIAPPTDYLGSRILLGRPFRSTLPSSLMADL